MLRDGRRFFLCTLLAGLTLRLLFFVYFPSVTDDSRVYIDIATNWLQHGIYGQSQLGQIVPTDTRLPGYAAFLSMIFGLLGAANIHAVLLTQIMFDLGTCLIIADLARRAVSDRAGRFACLLAALCPFLANYSAAVLSETLEIFFTTVALDCAIAAADTAYDQKRNPTRSLYLWLWAACGAAIAACILLRPDGGILLAAVVLWLALPLVIQTTRPPRSDETRPRTVLLAAFLVILVALAPLLPWTLRNFRALHHFQPLAPRYANESDELAPRGFNHWVKTWMAEYVSVEEIYWNVPGDTIDIAKLPSRALDTAPGETLALIADYNQSRDLTRQIDARFGAIATENIRAHPLRYYMVLPVARVADMWFRPRTEILPPDIRWWEFDDDVKWSVMAVGFALLNLAYVIAALAAVVQWQLRGRPRVRYLGLLAGFVALRSAFLLTIENPEPRYTLECWPVIVVLAAAFVAARNRQVGSL